jgi:hypothetical protein
VRGFASEACAPPSREHPAASAAINRRGTTDFIMRKDINITLS